MSHCNGNLIFISGRGSAISSVKEGKSGCIYLVKSLISFLSCAYVRAFYENHDRINMVLKFINPQAHIPKKLYAFVVFRNIFEASAVMVQDDTVTFE